MTINSFLFLYSLNDSCHETPPVGTPKLLNDLGVYEIIYGFKRVGFLVIMYKWSATTLSKKATVAKVLKFITIKTEQSKE